MCHLGVEQVIQCLSMDVTSPLRFLSLDSTQSYAHYQLHVWSISQGLELPVQKTRS